MTEEWISGWGRTAWSLADVRSWDRARDVGPDLVPGGERGAIARGLGRAYGAAAQNWGGIVYDMSTSAAGRIEMDDSTGVATVDAGVSFDELLKFTVPRGWFVPVTPGTRFITVGGAIASDIHGKNHHIDGSFGNHVNSLDLLLSDGSVRRLSRDSQREWFWATVGGMGLTGVVLRATFNLLRIESSLVEVETTRFNDLATGLDLMNSPEDDRFRYSVAWIDVSARGHRLGRGVLTRGDHARITSDCRGDVLDYRPHVRLGAPPIVPNGIINPMTIRLFNEFWFRRAPTQSSTTRESIPSFFHPLDGVRNWNRIYGSAGFIQYQVIVPFDSTQVLEDIVGEFSRSRVGSFLAVLKRMGPGNEAPMSFPMPGWTLTVDVAAGTNGLNVLLRRLDERVLECGGRHYLAKDAHITADSVERSYHRFSEWKRVRDEMDPIGLWKSDLGRRLGLVK